MKVIKIKFSAKNKFINRIVRHKKCNAVDELVRQENEDFKRWVGLLQEKVNSQGAKINEINKLMPYVENKHPNIFIRLHSVSNHRQHGGAAKRWNNKTSKVIQGDPMSPLQPVPGWGAGKCHRSASDGGTWRHRPGMLSGLF